MLTTSAFDRVSEVAMAPERVARHRDDLWMTWLADEDTRELAELQ